MSSTLAAPPSENVATSASAAPPGVVNETSETEVDTIVGTRQQMVLNTGKALSKSLEALKKMGISGVALSADIIQAIINAIMSILRRLAQLLGVSVQGQSSEDAEPAAPVNSLKDDKGAGPAAAVPAVSNLTSPAAGQDVTVTGSPEALASFQAEFDRVVGHLAEALETNKFPKERLEEVLKASGGTKVDIFLKGVLHTLYADIASRTLNCERAKESFESLARAQAVTLGISDEVLLQSKDGDYEVSPEFESAREDFVAASDELKAAQNWFVAVAQEASGHPESRKEVEVLAGRLPKEFADRVQKSLISDINLHNSVAQTDAAGNKLSDNPALNEVRKTMDRATELSSAANPGADLAQTVPAGISRFGIKTLSVGDMEDSVPTERQAA